MTAAFALRVLMDVSLYLCAASLPGALFGLTTPLVASALWIALCAGLSFRLGGSRARAGAARLLRALPVAAMALSFAEPKSVADWVILAPAALYAAFLCLRRGEAPDYAAAMERFSLSWKIIAGVSGVMIVVGQWESFARLAAPSAFLCFLSSVLLLRMLRQDEAALRQRSFRLRNDLTVGLVAGVGLLLSTDAARRGALGALRGLWTYALTPILRLFVYLAVGVFWLLEKLFGWVAALLPEGAGFDGGALMQSLDLSELMELSAEGEGAGMAYLIGALKGLGALAAVTLVFLLLRYLARNRRRAASGHSGDMRESLREDMPARPLIDMPPRDGGERVRWYYRKYLAAARGRGLSVEPSDTTKEIERASAGVFPRCEEPLSSLREVYALARYRTRETVPPESVAKARRALSRLRAAKPR